MKLVMQTHTELLSVGPRPEDQLTASVPYPTDIFFNYTELDPLCDLLNGRNIRSPRVNPAITSVDGLVKTRFAARYAHDNGNSLVLQGSPKDLLAIYTGIVGLAGVMGWPTGLEVPTIVAEVDQESNEMELLRLSTPLARLFTADRQVQAVLLRGRGVA